MGTITEELFSRRLGHGVHAGDTVIAEVDVAMAHDVTGPLAIEAFRSLDLPLWDASRIVFNFDHVMPANTVAAAELHRVIREFCVEHTITNLFAEGICHQVMVDRRLARPGGIVVGADSHSTTYGGLGCFATGLGSTDIGVVFATGKTWFRIPETVRIEVRGALPRGVYAKDLALHVIAQMGADGADYCAVEWGGEAVTCDDRRRAADALQPEHRLRRQDRDRGAGCGHLRALRRRSLRAAPRASGIPANAGRRCRAPAPAGGGPPEHRQRPRHRRCRPELRSTRCSSAAAPTAGSATSRSPRPSSRAERCIPERGPSSFPRREACTSTP